MSKFRWSHLRLRSDERLRIVKTYKFQTGRYKTNLLDLFSTPFKNLKLFKPAVRKEVSHNFFANMVIDGWNNLPEEVIGASSTEAFTKKLRAVPLE